MTSTSTDMIVIRGRGRVSALGMPAAWSGPLASPFTTHLNGLPVAALPVAAEVALADLRASHPAYRQLDRTVLLALLAARQATAAAGWTPGLSQSNEPETRNQKPETNHHLAVSIGSSRGATGRLEQFHAEFLSEGSVPAAASPSPRWAT
ncbi:hypothetical protein LRS06_16585 [Hymenobacter sp. J193]|uniref:hypothetical protein n=1 Tax=Hymenobacter sp. J193 TaxID=2898429 RepID=UPI002151D4B6|nr:hypothetical protein [Hymenobacter sp. J193]MCR5889354.1 hypothetical protein [Hymenobacter sp. J193]